MKKQRVIEKVWDEGAKIRTLIRYDRLFEYPILLGLIVYRLNYTQVVIYILPVISSTILKYYRSINRFTRTENKYIIIKRKTRILASQLYISLHVLITIRYSDRIEYKNCEYKNQIFFLILHLISDISFIFFIFFFFFIF